MKGEKMKFIKRINPLFLKIFIILTCPIWFFPFALCVIGFGIWSVISDFVDEITR